MPHRYATLDVFTDTPLAGNPLAVVHDADGLDAATMQQIAREFGYSETVFVLTAPDDAATARLRIFTPTTEVPFAGHPVIGTAFALAGQAKGRPAALTFALAAGLVPVALSWAGDRLTAAELTAPQGLHIGPALDVAAVAACGGLAASDLSTAVHAPCVASVGLGFVVAEVADRAALARARADAVACAALLPVDGADAVFFYCRTTGPQDGGADITARMFCPTDLLPEDPATGSAAAAAAAMLARCRGVERLALGVAQGVDMGRPSRLQVSVEGASVRVRGQAVAVCDGVLHSGD